MWCSRVSQSRATISKCTGKLSLSILFSLSFSPCACVFVCSVFFIRDTILKARASVGGRRPTWVSLNRKQEVEVRGEVSVCGCHLTSQGGNIPTMFERNFSLFSTVFCALIFASFSTSSFSMFHCFISMHFFSLPFHLLISVSCIFFPLSAFCLCQPWLLWFLRTMSCSHKAVPPSTFP